MGEPFSGNTDPTPYIMACYLIGVGIMLGFLVWNLREKKRLIELRATMKQSSGGHANG